MDSHHIKATVEEDGTLILKELPFPAGAQVDVTIVEDRKPLNTGPYPLRGTPVTYSDPYEPVAVDEWESAR
jgi:hypothetical protein